MNAYQKLEQCLAGIRAKTDFIPQIGLILGSGLGDYADNIEIAATVDYHDIEGFPVSTVTGHKGRFVFGYVEKIPVVIMQGRVHYYEGYSMQDVVLPTRLIGMMGAKALFLTNAAGGVNLDFHSGCLMMITDQISCLVPSPLIGENLDQLGVRFPDMCEIYDKKLCEAVRSSAKKLDIPLEEGTYLQFTGPAYESPAEIKMSRVWGADAVGMSTACEAVAANHMGMRICGISCITNMAAGISGNPLTHEEVKETADRVSSMFQKLVTASIVNIAKEL